MTGRTQWFLVKSEPIFDEHEQVQLVVTVVIDVTERYLLEQRKDDFITMTSHELRTPLTVLKGLQYLLQRHLAKYRDEQGLSLSTRMDGQLDQFTKRISDLLDSSQIQAGKLTYQKASFDLDALVREVIQTMQETVQTHCLLFEDQANVEIYGDKERIEQVLTNLLTNAINYSPQADKIMLRLSISQGQALLSVQDFGVGIDQAEQATLFERFYQVIRPNETASPGLGLGLSICKEIIKQHDGHIWFESCHGKGTIFYVMLPLQSEEK